MENRKRILYFLFLVLMMLPLLQKWTHLIKEEPLAGFFKTHDAIALTPKTWFDGTFQTAFDANFNDSLGFHNTMIRIRNRVGYELFHKSGSKGVLLGKDDFMFEKDYIQAYYGEDYLGKNAILQEVSAVKKLQDELQRQGKTLIVVLAPGKADYHPEKIPKHWVSERTDSTNYLQFSKILKKQGVNFIDLNQWFLEQKSNTPYPLYPPYGTHWSYYGMLHAADSIIRYTEQLTNQKLRHIVITKNEVDKKPRFTDFDLGSLMNMTGNPFKEHTLCYPVWHWSPDTNVQRPRLLVISDSYYWEIYNAGFQQQCFTGSFWYYNSTVYPDSYTKETLTPSLNIKAELDSVDIVMIMSTTIGLKTFSWDFVKRCNDAMNNE